MPAEKGALIENDQLLDQWAKENGGSKRVLNISKKRDAAMPNAKPKPKNTNLTQKKKIYKVKWETETLKTEVDAQQRNVAELRRSFQAKKAWSIERSSG